MKVGLIMNSDKIYRYTLKKFKDIAIEDVEWLWYPYFPLGKISFIAGDPGCGKSYQAINLASIVSNGGTLPLSNMNAPQGLVIIQNAEDGAGDTIKKRLVDLGANEENIYLIDLKEEFKDTRDILLCDVEDIDALLEELHPKLLIFDPIQAFLGDIDMNSANKVRNLLKPIGQLAEKHNCAIVFVVHRNKGLAGSNQIYRMLGSIDFAGIARSIVTIAKNDNETLFINSKNNLAERGKTLAFKISNNKIEWLGERDYQEEPQNINETIFPRDIAQNFILEYLKNNNYAEFTDIINKARKQGIRDKTLIRARNNLKEDNLIDKKKDGQKTIWYLAEK